MQFKPLSSRAVALFTGGVLAATTLFHPAPAQADKAKTYKYGAIGLGVLGAYMLSKGKTVPGAAAVAAGAYAYKKSRDAEKSDRYDDYRTGNSRSSYPQYSSNYPDYNSNYPEYDASYGTQDRYERRQDRREQRRAERQGQREVRRDNYDLSPYLR